MDPLSISASVITVTTLITQVAKAFAQLRRDYKELPGRLIALNNEVADLAVVITEIDAVIKARQHFLDEEESTLPTLLGRAEVELRELHRVVEYLWEKEAGSRVLQRATIWRKWHPRLQSLQNELRQIKGNLNILLGASNSRDMLRMRLDLEDISRTTSNESDQQTQFREQLTTSLESQGALLRGVGDIGMKIEQRLHQIETLLAAQYGFPPQYTTQNMVANRVAMNKLAESSVDLKMDNNVSDMDRSLQAVAVRASRYSAPGCMPHCPCRCHVQHQVSSKDYLGNLLGRLFLGYSGMPLINAKCNSTQCRQRQGPSIAVEYWFPVGFCWSQILRLELAYHQNLGPEWQLKTMRQVPDSALCVKYALEGNINGLQQLFNTGLASPRDVSSTRGYTLLRWALYGQKYEACQFLLAAGSDPDYRPIAASDDCPSVKACDILLRGNISSEVEQVMRLISRGTDFVDNQNFSRLHKIVLGLMFGDLRTEILREPAMVDATDALGRTALEWAAARGDCEAIIILLGFGADPNVMDKKLNTPLTLASNQSHTTAVRLLLEAGATPDPKLPKGVKFGTPLNCAARNAKDPTLIKLLLDFDANVEACGVDGVTPLLHIARTKPPSFARLLLDYGADINVRSRDGRTPLTTSIIHNNHGVLRLLLDRWFEYTACPRLQAPHLLELSAKHADLETMSLLSNATHVRLRRDKTYALDCAKFESYLHQRPDVTDKLVAAFGSLVESICEDVEVNKARSWWSALTTQLPHGLTKRDPEANASDSPDEPEFFDAHESLSLATNDLIPLLRRRQALAGEISDYG